MASLAALVLASVAAAACGVPPGPQGWAAPRPIMLPAQKVILVTHTSHLYALPEGSSNANWQFPPKDKSTYPISDESKATLSSAIDALDTNDSQKSDLQKKLNDLTLTGPSVNALKDAVKVSSAPSNKTGDLNTAIDSIIKTEKDYQSNLQAIYGDLGVSSDSKTVYVATFRGILFALDAQTGHIRWARDTGGEMVGGVAVDGNVLYFGTKARRVYAVDATTGDQKWSLETGGDVWATPTVDGDNVYFTSLDGSVIQLDKATGNKNWLFSGAQSGIASHAVVSGSSVYVGAFDNKLYSLKTSDGSVNWTVKADNWFWATPVVSDGTVYAASLDGKVYAVDANSGAKKWTFDSGSAIRAAPVIAGNGLVVASKNGNVNKLDLETGQRTEGSPVQVGTKILSDLVADGTTVYVSPSSPVLYELDASGNLGLPGGTPLPQ